MSLYNTLIIFKREMFSFNIKAIMKSNKIFKTTFALLVLIALFSCKKDDVTPSDNPSGGTDVEKAITFNFKAQVNQSSDYMNKGMIFQNAFGNQFGITKLRYLISDIVLHKTDGTSYVIEGYHYIDMDDLSTISFTPSEKITSGTYESVELVFGFTPENNISFQYPELNQIGWNWPDAIGGGYHFMQLEGNYINENNETTAYLTHLGPTIDQTTSETINNDVRVVLPKTFTVSKGATQVSVDIEMNIDQWYDNPNTIDLNVFGAAIMGSFDAQIQFQENGENGVFKVGDVTIN